MFKDLSPASKIFFSLFILVVSGIIIYFLGALLAIPIFHINYFTNPDLISNLSADNIGALRYFQILNSLGLFVIPPFIIAWLFYNKVSEGLYFNKRVSVLALIFTGLAILVSQPLINSLAVANSWFKFPESLSFVEQWFNQKEALAEELTVAFLQMNNIQDFIINLLMIGLIPALGEELVFRAVYQRLFTEWFKNAHVAILITAFFFSALHLQFYGFLPRFFLGIFLGYLLLWSGNIWYPIVAHFLNNAGAVIYYYIFKIDIAEEYHSVAGTGIDWFLLGTSVATFLVFCYLFYGREKQLIFKRLA